MTKISIFLILCLTVVYINAYSYSSENPKESCGDHIPQILSVVCGGRYYTPKMYKKSSNEDSSAHSDLTSNEYIPEYEEYLRIWASMDRNHNERHFVPVHFPFKARSDAFDMSFNRFRRQPAGIVEECCDKSCTVDEMREYCE